MFCFDIGSYCLFTFCEKCDLIKGLWIKCDVFYQVCVFRIETVSFLTANKVFSFQARRCVWCGSALMGSVVIVHSSDRCCCCVLW